VLLRLRVSRHKSHETVKVLTATNLIQIKRGINVKGKRSAQFLTQQHHLATHCHSAFPHSCLLASPALFLYFTFAFSSPLRSASKNTCRFQKCRSKIASSSSANIALASAPRPAGEVVVVVIVVSRAKQFSRPTLEWLLHYRDE
jgi:hypothetical protein